MLTASGPPRQLQGWFPSTLASLPWLTAPYSVISPQLPSQRAFPDRFISQWAASTVLHGEVLSFLNIETGKSLEHYVLCCYLCLGSILGTLYSNELDRLYQGIGIDQASPSEKHAKGTNTYHVLCYEDTPLNVAKTSLSQNLHATSSLRSPTPTVLASPSTDRT